MEEKKGKNGDLKTREVWRS